VKSTIFTKEEKNWVENPDVLNNLSKDIVKWSMDKINDPSHLLDISKNANLMDINFVFEVGKTIRDKINDLKKQKAAEKLLQTELHSLQQEREKALESWKFLEDDKLIRLRELERNSLINSFLRPNYLNASTERLDEIDQKVLIFMIDCVFAQSDELEDRILNPRKYPNLDQL